MWRIGIQSSYALPQSTTNLDDMEKKDIIISSEILYRDIDKCISDLIQARAFHDPIQEEGVRIRMESLMVGAMQQLDCIIDYLKEKEQWEKKTSHQIAIYSSGRQRIWERRKENGSR